MFKHLNISKVSNVVSRILLRFILLYPSIICIQLISTNRFEIELAGVFRETILSFELQTREPPKWFKNDDCFELLRVCIVCFFECIVYSIRENSLHSLKFYPYFLFPAISRVGRKNMCGQILDCTV